MPTVTKQRLAEEFYKLLEQKSIDKIVIKDISDACGMSRQSFYYHFQDILALVEWMAEQAIQKALSRSLEKDDPVDAIEQFVIMTVENQDLIRKLASSQWHEQFQLLFFEGIKTYLMELMRHRRPDHSMSRSEMDTAVAFYSGGVAALLLIYSGDKKTDTRRLAQRIVDLISCGNA